jgi:hypothetical protein
MTLFCFVSFLHTELCSTLLFNCVCFHGGGGGGGAFLLKFWVAAVAVVS